MKILKRIGLVLLIIVGLYVISAFFCPSTIHVERSTMVNTDARTAFDHVNTLKKWKSWSYWDNIDTKTMKDTFYGPESGVGAVHGWDSPNDSVGKGTLTITKSEPAKFVETKLDFEGMGSSMSGWKFNDTTGGVMVTVYMDAEPPFLMRPIAAMMNMDKMLGPDFEKSLAGLKKTAESAGQAAPQVKIETTTVAPMEALLVSDSGTTAEMGQKMGKMYGEIQELMKKNGAQQTGAPFAIYHKQVTNPDGSMMFWFEAGIPVDKEVKPAGRVQYRELPGGNAVKAEHRGRYEELGATYQQLSAWIGQNGKKVTGDSWEVYVTDPMTEKDTANWVTEVYFPVE